MVLLSERRSRSVEAEGEVLINLYFREGLWQKVILRDLCLPEKNEGKGVPPRGNSASKADRKVKSEMDTERIFIESRGR